MDIANIFGPIDCFDGGRNELVPVVPSGEVSGCLHSYKPTQSLGEHSLGSFRFQVVFGVVGQVNEVRDVLVNIQAFHDEPL